jgi:hypothetical protein
LDGAASLQTDTFDRSLLVVWHELAILGRNTETMDIEVGLGCYALVEVARAALNVDARFRGQLRDTFA